MAEPEYEPSRWAWVREQVEAYERSGGTEATTLRDTGLPVVVVTHVGNRTGKLRKSPVMRVEHDGQYAIVGSVGGWPPNCGPCGQSSRRAPRRGEGNERQPRPSAGCTPRTSSRLALTSTWRRRPDLATGTLNATGGNFFVWLVQNSNNNEGYLPTSASLAYRTQDMGDVQAILSYQCAGGGMPDLIVGTKSPTANQGTIEVWENSNAASPTFTRREIYPPYGLIPGNRLGEVTAMALADFDQDGRKDLVVGTRTGTYTGQVLFFKHVGDTTGLRFIYQFGLDLTEEAVTALACLDVDGDGDRDVAVGTQRSLSQGNLLQLGNYFDGTTWKFAEDREVNAPGVVMSLAAADFGGASRTDLAVGYRNNMGSYVGGVRVYFCETDRIPVLGSDPSGGSVAHMVPALTNGNYNYGVRPALPSPPYLTDLAAGVKITASTGALVVFVR